MNVPLTTSTNTGKLNFFTKVKRCFSYKKFNLRTLIKDVFEKSKPTTNQGSKMTEKKFVQRNFLTVSVRKMKSLVLVVVVK